MCGMLMVCGHGHGLWCALYRRQVGCLKHGAGGIHTLQPTLRPARLRVAVGHQGLWGGAGRGQGVHLVGEEAVGAVV